ncbi:MAG: gamma-glutamylcyclotransferase [Anaerolineae bacterium]|nr:gamma-glutamylcyclotransferase [Anaerolineae bacterium]
MVLLFVYGTLQDPAVQERIIGRVVIGTPDTLEGFFKSQMSMPEGIYPLVIPRHGHEVAGLVLEVTEEELRRMDVYETTAYRRVRVPLRSGRESWVYA